MRKDWGYEDELMLATEYGAAEHAGLSSSYVDKVVAEALERTEASVRSKRRRMGLTDMESRNSPQNASESLPEPVLGEIVADYVEMGGGLTLKEVARKYGLAPGEVRKILTRHDVTKASLPIAPTVLRDSNEDEIVDRVLLEKERRVSAKIEAKRITKMEADYRKLLEERHSQDRFLEAAKAVAAAMPRCDVVQPIPRPAIEGERWVAHIPTTDEHVGSLVWGEESFGENYDTHIACDRLRRHADLAAEWITSQPGECVEVQRTFIGDLFHGLMGSTEHGTLLHQDSRGAKIWIELLAALRYSVAALAQVCDSVQVRGVRGNHDGAFEFFAAMYALRETFYGHPGVDVVVTPDRYDAFLVKGKEGGALHVLDHGYGMGSVGNWKSMSQLADLARTFPDYHDANTVYAYYGHLHQLETASHGDFELIRLPAFAETDDYSSSLRFYATPSAHFIRLSADNGKIRSVHRVYRDDFKPDYEESA